jgi:hypothetical protein
MMLRENILNKVAFAAVIPVILLAGLAVYGVDFFFDLSRNIKKAQARKKIRKGTWLQNKSNREFIQITKIDPPQPNIFNIFSDFKYYYKVLRPDTTCPYPAYLLDTQLIRNYEIKEPSKILKIFYEQCNRKKIR